MRDGALNQEAQPAMYVPFAQVPDGVTALNRRPARPDAVALLAVWLPALRATKIDPIDALRCE